MMIARYFTCSLGLSFVLASCGDTTWPHPRTDAEIADLVSAGRQHVGFDCAGDGITDSGLQALDGYEGVQGIWLRGCSQVTGSGFDVFGRMPVLTGVSIWNCPITNAHAFDFMRASSSIKEVILVTLRLDDGALNDIARSETLEVIRLHEVDGVTDAGLLALAATKGLRELHVHECPDITAEGMADFRRARPDCKHSYSE